MKLNDNPHIAGYKPYRNSVRYPNHGGVCMYVRHSLIEFIDDVKFFNDDMILVTFSFIPDITFCGCYSPPSDSHYFDIGVFSYISATVLESANKFVIMGDLNAKIKNREDLVADREDLSYVENTDVCNTNGDLLKNICRDGNLVVLNNLCFGEKNFSNELTFRRKQQWISQLDLCIVSRDILPDINSFDVIQDLILPSDHAIISLDMNIDQRYAIKKELKQSVHSLVDFPDVRNTKSIGEKPIPMLSINSLDFRNNASTIPAPATPSNVEDFQFFCDRIYTVLYELSSNSLIQNPKVWDTSLARWTRLLNSNDSRTVWKAINWKGELTDHQQVEPTVEEFRSHFETLLNPDGQIEFDTVSLSDSPFIPVLDDPITLNEVKDCIAQSKPNKACDLNGLSPGIFKHLPAQWILTIVSLLNIVFSTIFIPSSWIYSKLIVIFKKGCRKVCGNFRGISINDTIYRIFDRVLYNRLALWYKPSVEQAGCQEKRGCVEQILTLRLLCDYAKKKRVKLFLLYIDFEKAYDKVPRKTLLDIMKSFGCGGRFLSVLGKIYTDIKLIFKIAVIQTSIGVRQGAASSCLLFIIFLDVMVRMINQSEDDGFLKCFHSLLLMDDTVLLATSRQKLIKKFQIVQQFCREYGMSINVSKTKFMVINGDPYDKRPIMSNGILVKYCHYYLYLGAYITDDGNYKSSIDMHANDKKKHFLKYVSFLQKNCDFPFTIKRRVAEACLFSTILYSCETWCCSSFGKLETIYMGIIKTLLAVRQTTCNDLCLVECGMPSLKALIRQRQHKYFIEKVRNLQDDSPLKFALNLVQSVNTASYRIINEVLADSKFLHKDKFNLFENIRSDFQSTKRMTYLSMNPLLTSPQVYQNSTIKEYKRIQYTRARLSSHYLRVETGRWSRIPREERLCTCGKDIQTEAHVILSCELTEEIRRKHMITHSEIDEIFSLDDNVVVNFVYEIMQKTKP